MNATNEYSSCSICNARLDLICKKCFQLHVGRARSDAALLSQARANARENASRLLVARKSVLLEKVKYQENLLEAERLRESLLQMSQQVANERVQFAALSFSVKNSEELLSEGQIYFKSLREQEESTMSLAKRGLNWYSGVRERILLQRRLERALQLFMIFPIEIPITDTQESFSNQDLRTEKSKTGLIGGIGAICGLPLPNNGPYLSIPNDVLTSALYLVARLVDGISECLDSPLPHSIRTDGSGGYASIVTGVIGEGNWDEYPLRPLDKEDTAKFASEGDFETAMDLLRRDVVTLCVQGAGVPIDRLWPAEALLLNLWELHIHAAQQLVGMRKMALPYLTDHVQSEIISDHFK